MIIGVKQGQGGKDCNVMLSPHLVNLPRACRKAERNRAGLSLPS
jgi:hypothetical protein